MTDFNLDTCPLTRRSDRPLQIPPFDEIAELSPAEITAAIDAAFEKQDEEIAAITNTVNAPTWENTVEAFQASGQHLERALTWLFNLLSSDSTDELEKIGESVTPKLAARSDAIYTNADLFSRIEAADVPAGDAEAQFVKDKLIRDFVRRGARLSDEDKKEMGRLNEKIAVLEEKFGNNLLRSTKELAVTFDTEDQLDGLSSGQISAAKKLSEKMSRDGWTVALGLPSVQPAQVDLTNHESREKLFEASLQRGAKDNPDVLVELVQLRARRARLLGYDTHADFAIAESTTPSTAAAMELLVGVAPAAARNATKEREALEEMSGETVAGADWPYWEDKLRTRDFALNGERLKKYFPLWQVLEDGVFYAAKRLYGLSFRRRPDIKAYVDTARIFEVSDDNGETLGLFIGDYEARPGKRGGAWMTNFVEQSHLLDTKPVIVNVLSIAFPADGSTPLLTLDEVNTLFHEFGHALHGLFANNRYPLLSGTNVPRDFVEFPSQINENWALEPKVLTHYAIDPQSGEKISQEDIDAIVASRKFGQGFAAGEYLAASLIDLAWHTLTVEQADQLQKTPEFINDFESAALRRAGLIVDGMEPRYKSTYFNHIFAGGYSAGYFSYLWSEALDADGFEGFKDRKATGPNATDEDVRAAGQAFRDEILSRGGAIDYAEAFTAFRGKAKDLTPLLKRRGLEG